jgi:hypothetical protein
MRIKLLDREYEEVINANITTDPDKYEGLLTILKDRSAK